MDTLLETIRDASDSVNQVSGSVKRITTAMNQTAAGLEQRNSFAIAANWVGIGLKFWQTWKAIRGKELQPEAQRQEIRLENNVIG